MASEDQPNEHGLEAVQLSYIYALFSDFPIILLDESVPGNLPLLEIVVPLRENRVLLAWSSIPHVVSDVAQEVT